MSSNQNKNKDEQVQKEPTMEEKVQEEKRIQGYVTNFQNTASGFAVAKYVPEHIHIEDRKAVFEGYEDNKRRLGLIYNFFYGVKKIFSPTKVAETAGTAMSAGTILTIIWAIVYGAKQLSGSDESEREVA